ncbi:MAG: class I SAM-dependent methyltransferase, partial [Propionicimonas sp.]
AVALAGPLLAAGAAVFVDPARRTAAGRTWRVADFSPPWDFATGLLAGRLGCLKAAPGLPAAFVPDALSVTWVSHRGSLVETSLWAPSAGDGPALRRAVLLPSGSELVAGRQREAAVGPLGRYLFEPDPAVIRAGAIGTLAAALDARAAGAGIAYLFADRLVATPFATAFEVVEVLAFNERTLRAWVREHAVGVLEIKVRGLDVDPALLRRQLKPKGSAAATLVLTPTPSGARALVVRRVPPTPPSGPDPAGPTA